MADYQDKITHTSQKEAVIDGYLGELNGFILYENDDFCMYRTTESADAVAAVAGSPLAKDAHAEDGVTYYTREAGGQGHSAGYLKDTTYVYTAADVETADAANKYYP